MWKCEKSLKWHIYIQALNHSTALFTIKTTDDGSFISFYSILRFLFRNNTFPNGTIVNVSRDCCARLSHLWPHQFISNVKDSFFFPFIYRMCAIVIVVFFFLLLFPLLSMSPFTSVANCVENVQCVPCVRVR